MKGADILAEIEDVLRTKPTLQALRQDTDETFSWLGEDLGSHWTVGYWCRSTRTELCPANAVPDGT